MTPNAGAFQLYRYACLIKSRQKSKITGNAFNPQIDIVFGAHPAFDRVGISALQNSEAMWHWERPIGFCTDRVDDIDWGFSLDLPNRHILDSYVEYSLHC